MEIMKVLLLSKRYPLLSTLAILLVGFSSAFLVQKVLADITVIHACVRTTILNGAPNIRIVDENTNCNSNETALSWNQQGQPGPQGPAGPQGPSGSSGPIFCPGCQISGNYPSMVGKDFTGADLNFVQIGNINLSQANFTNAYLNSVYFTKGVTLDNTIFHNATSDSMNLFINIHGVNTDFSNIHGPIGPSVIGFSNKDVTITNCNFQNANVVLSFSYSGGGTNDPDMSGCNFSNANLAGTPDTGPSSFLNVNLTNANFTGTNLSGVTGMDLAKLTGATWSNTTCPDNTIQNDCTAHLNP